MEFIPNIFPVFGCVGAILVDPNTGAVCAAELFPNRPVGPVVVVIVAAVAGFVTLPNVGVGLVCPNAGVGVDCPNVSLAFD